jgi:hypothetical protein
MNENENHDKNLDLVIKTSQGTWETSFPKTTKVEEVIKAIIQHFGFAQNGKYELRLEREPKTALEPNRPLVSYGIKDDDVLIFTDLGIAV